jgi:hypothetical protein
MESAAAFESDLSSVEMPEIPGGEITAEEVGETTPTEEVAASTVEESAETEETEKPKEAAAAPDKEKLAAAAQSAAAKPAAKQLTFTADGKPVALVENAEIDWKVDGKLEKVKVKDLLDNWSGKVSYDRKFNELSQQRKGFQEEAAGFQRDRERHKALISDMHAAVRENRVFDAVANMLEMTGLDKQVNAKEYIGQLRNALAEQAKALSTMTPEQRQLHESKEEQAYQKSKYDQLVQQREREQAERTFHARVTKEIERAKSTTEEFVKTRDWLVDRFKANKEDLSKLTPEYIADHLIDVRDYSIAQKAMDSVDPELSKNEALWEQTVLLMRANPTWTQEDVKQIFQKAVGEKRAKAVSKKLSKAPVATVAKAATKSKAARKVDASDENTFTADDLSW